MIPDDVVAEVRARADIVEIVGEVVDLKKAGKDFKGRCPFHDDHSPSFYVVPTKGFYHCFGCGEDGDVFSFVMKRMGLDFVEAVKHVGARSGVVVREVRGRRPEEDPNRPLHEANAFADDFFQKRLWESDDGAGARAYLERRGIDRETAERFHIGFAPDDRQALSERASQHGIEQEVLLELGLLARGDATDEPFDRFRNRLMFAIEDLVGRVVGFGGRVLPGNRSRAKYVNSPESTVYHKGRVLYGLARAKNAIRRQAGALVVEGYMDVVSLAATGVENVVAALGTALTDDQARLLKRFTTQAYLCFDSDAAGLRATFRAGDVLLAEGVHPSVVTLPVGEDPDSIVREGGAEALRPHLDAAVDVLDRKVQILEERGYFQTIEKTRQAIDRLLPTLRAAADPTLRDLYVDRVAARTGVQKTTLERELTAAPVRRVTPAPPRAAGSPAGGRGTRIRGMGAERQLLLLMVKDRSWIEAAREAVGPEDFVDRGYRRIFELLVDQPELDHPPAELEEGPRRRLEDLLADTRQFGEAGRVFEETVSRLRGAAVDRRLQALDREIAEAQQSRAEQRVRDLMIEKQTLSRERAEGTVTRSDWRRTSRKTLGLSAQHTPKEGSG